MGSRVKNLAEKIAAIRTRRTCCKAMLEQLERTGEDQDLADRPARLAKRPGVLDRRRETVEHPFGTIKQWMNQGAFLMRGLEKVRAEFSLTSLAYNLRRVLNLVSFTELMATVAA